MTTKAIARTLPHRVGIGRVDLTGSPGLDSRRIDCPEKQRPPFLIHHLDLVCHIRLFVTLEYYRTGISRDPVLRHSGGEKYHLQALKVAVVLVHTVQCRS